MAIKHYYNLSILERKCTFCNKDIRECDILENNYIQTYKNRYYRLAHKTCYYKYLKYVKDTRRK